MNNPQEIINNLSPEEAFAILRQLAAQDEKLAAEIAALALARMSDVDIDEIADALRYELERLTPEDVWERSGNTRYGYVDTGEAAYQIIEELLEPYLDEMRQCQNAELYLEAEQIFLGLLLGFYHFEYEVKSEFKDWAAEAPLEFARRVVGIWQERNANTEDDSAILAFIEAELPRWAWVLLPLIKGEQR